MKKLAVILHLYYEEQIPFIKKHLNNLNKANIAYDLIITYPETKPFLITAIKENLTHPENEKINSVAGGATTVPQGRGAYIDVRNPTEEGLPFTREVASCTVVGDKFCEITVDVPQGRGAYIDVRDPTEVGLPSASQFAKFIPTTNRGYDIAPFITALKSLELEKYDYILKLHTKNQDTSQYICLEDHRMTNKIWSKIMWNALLGSPQKIKKNIKILDGNQKIGLLTAKYCLVSAPKHYDYLLGQINHELQVLNFEELEQLNFPAGTMFLARANLLKPLLRYTPTDFPPTNAKTKDGTLAHVIERLIGALVITQGYTLAPIKHKTYTPNSFLSNLKRFVYQKKQTKSGKTRIKFCKIPIW